MIYIYLSDTERSRKGFICHVFPEDFLFFFFETTYIDLTVFSYICCDNHIHLSCYQMTILPSSFPILLVFIIAVSCFPPRVTVLLDFSHISSHLLKFYHNLLLAECGVSSAYGEMENTEERNFPFLAESF